MILNEILQYIASKYFYNSTIEMYTSHETLGSSLFVVKYFADKNSLVFQKKPAIIKDYTGLFGKDKNGIKNVPLALVVLVQRRSFDAHGVGNLLHAHRIVPLLRKQPKGFP